MLRSIARAIPSPSPSRPSDAALRATQRARGYVVDAVKTRKPAAFAKMKDDIRKLAPDDLDELLAAESRAAELVSLLDDLAQDQRRRPRPMSTASSEDMLKMLSLHVQRCATHGEQTSPDLPAAATLFAACAHRDVPENVLVPPTESPAARRPAALSSGIFEIASNAVG